MFSSPNSKAGDSGGCVKKRVILHRMLAVKTTAAEISAMPPTNTSIPFQPPPPSTTMPKINEKECPRCRKPFACQPDDIANCGCAKVVLTAETRAFLKKTNYDCLCSTCLEQLNVLVAQAQRSPLPTRPHEFIEGLHFYRDNGNWVFTEFYYIQRGYCCQNGCRHCAYHFKGRS